MDEKRLGEIEEISKADWAQTPESVKGLVKNLLGRIEQLEERNQVLTSEVEGLKEQVKRNSRNSSKPPSQDQGKGFKTKSKEKGSKKPRGGQTGHKGHEQKLYPAEECESVKDYYPGNCDECGAELTGEDPQPYRVQQVEIPVVKPVVREHRFHGLTCERCGSVTRAWDEEIINGSRYGERVVAHVGVLSGQYRQSHRMVQELMREFFGIELSVGSINELRTESSKSLAGVVEVAKEYVQEQDCVNMDETSFKQGNSDGNNTKGKKGWLWVMVTPLVSYFEVFLSRAGEVCQKLLGEGFTGIVGSDRCGAYNGVKLENRQVCWAHLKRDFTQIGERSGVSAQLGQTLLEQERLLFEQWYQVRDGTLSRTEFATEVQPIRTEVKRLLEEGGSYDITQVEKTPLAKTVRTCRQLLKVEPALWTFVTTEGVEPTNNSAERALRPAVLWRKNSFGSQSAKGSLFVSRMLTVVTSLRSQNRPVLEYLVLACRAARQGQSPPSLVPSQD